MPRSLEEFRETNDASTLSVPLHRHLGIELEREPSGRPRAKMAGRRELLGEGGVHSPAAVYVLADVAAGICLCDEIAPHALAAEMAAMFLTVSARFTPIGEASGALEATAEVTKGLGDGQGGRPPKKATVDVVAHVHAAGGEPVAEQQASFYVRFMAPDRLRELAPESSQLVQVLEA